MKKILFVCFALATLASCGSNDPKTDAADKKPTETKEPAGETSLSDNPDYAAGLELVAKSDCFTCHKVDELLTGPSYRDVANKYAAEAPGIIPKLADKIMKGGTGVWGQVPMIAHPDITQEDAEKMVKYILLLKK